MRVPVLLLCDHASNAVPDDIDLGIAPDLLDRHIAVDIGAGPLTVALAAAIPAPAILGTVSRLVIDVHREPDHPGLIPQVTDGHVIPGNVTADRFARIARFHAPYHRAIADQIRRQRPGLIVAIHSFTPRLESGDAGNRPWQVGILSNRDRRAADPAIAFLTAQGLTTGDNEPYSGRLLNTTLNRHGEANGIPSLSVEVRNDLIGDAAGISHWCDIIARMIDHVRNSLAWMPPPAT
jgi:predicted N-formylglutamate amidohydrolase